MPYVTNQDCQIHYHVEGKGPCLVLQHGFSASIEAWYEFGYVDYLKDNYRLVLVDARGHGLSSKPHKPHAYTMESRVGDVLAVLDELSIEKTHFLGYSMGGRMAFGLAQYAPHRLSSLIIGGMHPYYFNNGPAVQALSNGTDAWITFLESIGGPLPPRQRTMQKNNDADALLACQQEGWEPIDHVLPAMTMPCLFFVGEADGLHRKTKEFASRLSNSTFLSLPKLNHGQGIQRSDLILPHLTSFLEEVQNSL